jgi:hypothetical protein
MRLLIQVSILLLSTHAFAETSKLGQYFCYVTKTAGIRGAAMRGGIAAVDLMGFRLGGLDAVLLSSALRQGRIFA